MRLLTSLLCTSLIIFFFIPVQAVQNYSIRDTNKSSEVEILFEEFDRLNLLPQSFDIDKLNDEILLIDCICLISRISDWGEKLWIQRTSSSINRFFFKVRRYFGYLNSDTDYLLDASEYPDASSLLMAKRWINEVRLTGIDMTVRGWQMMELEYKALSHMLCMARIPRTLNQEIALLLTEIDEVRTNILLLYSRNDFDKVAGFDLYSGDRLMWAYYLSGLQHELLPSKFIESSFSQRPSPKDILNKRLTKLNALLIADRMIDYIDRFTGDVTGYDKKLSELKTIVISRSRLITGVIN